MATYRKIYTKFWRDVYVKKLSPEERYFYFYLLTNPHTTQSGMYNLPLDIASIECGYSIDTVSGLLKKLIDTDKVLYDDVTEEILITNWFKHNWNDSDRVKKCVLAQVDEIESKILLEKFHEYLAYYEKDIYSKTDKKYKNKHKHKHDSIDTVSIEYPYSIKEDGQNQGQITNIKGIQYKKEPKTNTTPYDFSDHEIINTITNVKSGGIGTVIINDTAEFELGAALDWYSAKHQEYYGTGYGVNNLKDSSALIVLFHNFDYGIENLKYHLDKYLTYNDPYFSSRKLHLFAKNFNKIVSAIRGAGKPKKSLVELTMKEL